MTAMEAIISFSFNFVEYTLMYFFMDFDSFPHTFFTNRMVRSQRNRRLRQLKVVKEEKMVRVIRRIKIKTKINIVSGAVAV